jgi:hypothetical protein
MAEDRLKAGLQTAQNQAICVRSTSLDCMVTSDKVERLRRKTKREHGYLVFLPRLSTLSDPAFTAIQGLT